MFSLFSSYPTFMIFLAVVLSMVLDRKSVV